MKHLIQPYLVGADVCLFLVNFERVCERKGFTRTSWSQRLLIVLPCQAADIIVRISKEDAKDCGKGKSSLLKKKYRLSTEAYRQRFRNSNKWTGEFYPVFAYA